MSHIVLSIVIIGRFWNPLYSFGLISDSDHGGCFCYLLQVSLHILFMGLLNLFDVSPKAAL